MGTNKKRGISLIVLVITIIVMIILATAIILSLSNSGIIGKANKAKTDSDTANLKEYVNTLRAEYELMTDTERSGQTFETYANSELEAKGYNKVAVGVDGEVYSNLTEAAKAAIKAGIKVGDIVTGYTLAAKTYETSGNENTAPTGTSSEGTPTKQTLKTDTAVTWKYIGIGEDGKLEIAADIPNKSIEDLLSEYKMALSGKGGYLNGSNELNKACASLYSTDKGTAKSMNIDHVTKILGYTGEKGAYYNKDGNYETIDELLTIEQIEKNMDKTLSYRQTPDGKEISTYNANWYKIDKTSDVKEMKNTENMELVYPQNEAFFYWLASPCVNVIFHYDLVLFDVRAVRSSSVGAGGTFYSNGDSYNCTYALRPVVSLLPNVQLEKQTDDSGVVWVIK